MKHLKRFNESVVTLDDNLKKELIYDIKRNYLYDITDEEHADEEAHAYLNGTIEELESISKQDTIKLYRLVWASSKSDIDTNNIGKHYVQRLDSLHEDLVGDLFYGIEDKGFDYMDDLYLIRVEAPTSDIDYMTTLINNVKFPFEEEITLKTDKGVKVLNISRFYN